MLHEPALFVSATNARIQRKWPDETLHKELTREAQNDGVEGDKCDVVRAFAVQYGTILRTRGWVERVSVAWREGIGEEDSFVKRVGFGGVDCVSGEDN